MTDSVIINLNAARSPEILTAQKRAMWNEVQKLQNLEREINELEVGR